MAAYSSPDNTGQENAGTSIVHGRPLPKIPGTKAHIERNISAEKLSAGNPSSSPPKLYNEESCPSASNAKASCPPSTQPGETFRWIKSDMIRKGTYGKVYFALNTTSGEMMAVKQLELPQTPGDRMKKNLKDFVNGLRNEGEILRRLDHENIVQYLGFEENAETVNIFLEYVPGGTLGECYRRSGRLREDVTKHFTAQILRGLSYLHSLNVIHRDMKADNILLEMTGVCKISGFELSKQLEEMNRADSIRQTTIYWMAPEMVNPGLEGYDSKVDIWSLGCVAQEMWTAKRPWSDETNALALIFKLAEPGAAPPLPDDLVLSKAAEHFRSECFQYDPRGRPTAAELLGHPYLELDEGWVFSGL